MAQLSKNIHILIADDDRGVREALDELFSRRGHAVHAAASGREALDIARHEPVDLSFLDMHMPDFTGLQLFRSLQELRCGAILPTILITSDLSETLPMEAHSLGIYRTLHKPLDADKVLNSLALLLDEFFRR